MNTPATPKHVIIIGGGITGLAAAHRLVERARQTGTDVDVTLLEATDRVGGVIKTVRQDGFLIEAGPDNFVTNKPGGVALCKRLGIDDQLLTTNEEHRRALVVRDGKLLPIPEGFLLMAPTKIAPVIKTKVFSWPGKFRMALEPLVPRSKDGGDESLAAFVTRRLGREALDRLVQPLIGGIYSADANTLSLKATMPRFLELEQKYGSLILGMRKAGKARAAAAGKNHGQSAGARYSLFVSCKSGLDTIINTLVDRIGRDKLRLSSPVAGVAHQHDRWQVRLVSGEVLDADAVIFATRATQAADLLGEVDNELAASLGSIQYSSSAVVHAAFKREQIHHPMDGFGFVVPHVEKRNIIACSFSSVKYDNRAPEGTVLLRGFLGGATQAHMFDLDDQTMVKTVLEEFHDLLGVTGDPIFTTVHRWPGCMPQYKVGHVELVGSIRAMAGRYHGLAMAGNAYEGVGIPDCISSGEQAADQLWDQ